MSKVRISIADLVWYISATDSSDRRRFGIVNQKKQKEEKVVQFQPLGGGTILSENGKQMLQESFDASDFEEASIVGLWDARFQVAQEKVKEVFALFSDVHSSEVFESNRFEDAFEAISGREILSEARAGLIAPRFIEVKQPRQAQEGADTSWRTSAVPVFRLFRIWEFSMPSDVLKSFVSSPNVRILTNEELGTTRGGSTAGKTKDGFLIQNNLFL